jgi:Ca-activated chloride channel family protein
MFSAVLIYAALLGQNTSAEGGSIRVTGKDGQPGMALPLKSTVVDADIAGMGARVTVRQSFVNDSTAPIEAIYTFPLPADGAVDRMRMQIGTRVIEGEIKRREEARAIYEEAKSQGRVASLLDQERPNIFTQSVANIMPGAEIDIEISYVQVLKFEEGRFEFSFPMTVGPRFIAPGTPDPGKITPPNLPPNLRSGNDVTMNVRINGGAPVVGLESVLHPITTEKSKDGTVKLGLVNRKEIPNRDFILRWETQGQGVQESLMSYWENGEGTFALMLKPPASVDVAEIQAKEVIFVMDQSGSQRGFPIEKSKELTLKLLPTLHPHDMFNVIGFSNAPNPLWPSPRPGSPENIAEAEEFVKKLESNGGTMFVPAVEAALSKPPLDGRMRIVIFNTDGFVGNDFEVLEVVKKYRANGRMFTFGIGNGVNRFLIDAMSVEGRGDSEIVTLAESADGAANRLIRRVESPVLTDIEARIEGVATTEVTPEHIPDVFLGKPIVLFGRYRTPGLMRIQLTGKLGGKPWGRTIEADLRQATPGGASLTSLWARRRVDDYMRQNWMIGGRGGANLESESKALTDRVTNLALKHGIMTQFTSFVAVEKKIVNVGGKQKTVNVPVELTDGVDPAMSNGANRNGGVALASPAMSRGGASFGGARGGGGTNTTGTNTTGTNTTGGSTGGAGGEAKTEDYRGSRPTETKISPKLPAEGMVEVQVKLSDLTDAIKAALKKAGLLIDDQDAGLKMVFGRIDAKKLKELAKIEAVKAIDPL